MKIAIIGIDWDVVDLIESLPNFIIFGFFSLSSDNTGEFKHLGSDENFGVIKNDHPEFKCALTIDPPRIKRSLYLHYGEENFITLQSPHSHMSPRSKIGHGSIIQRGVTIMPQVNIGKACKIHINATIHHDAQIGDFCTIGPGAIILGKVIIGDGVYVGAGAIIRQGTKVGDGVIIGAGAVVVKDVDPFQTIVGVPAKTCIPK